MENGKQTNKQQRNIDGKSKIYINNLKNDDAACTAAARFNNHSVRSLGLAGYAHSLLNRKRTERDGLFRLPAPWWFPFPRIKKRGRKGYLFSNFPFHILEFPISLNIQFTASSKTRELCVSVF